MGISISDINQKAGFIFQVEIGNVNRSEYDILLTFAEDNSSAIPVRCTIHDEL
jgi:hypothetical protein